MSVIQRLFITLLFVGIVDRTDGQSYRSIIEGKWVTKESILRPEIEHSSESAYLQYQFDQNNVVSYGTSQYELGHRSDYAIEGNSIKMFNSEFRIEGSGDELVLVAVDKSNSLNRINLIRKTYFDSRWLKHNPTTIISSYTFIGNFSLYDYVQSFSNTPDEFERNIVMQQYRPIPPRYDELLKIEFTFDQKGNVLVTSIDGLPKPSPANASKLKRRFESTSGYWINPITNQLGSDTVKLTFLTRGKSSLDFREKAFKHFQKAAEYFGKVKYQEGMALINKAIALQDDNAQFYILRSLFYFKSDNLDKYCGDIIKAHSINPFVELIQREDIDGETVEIKCATQ